MDADGKELPDLPPPTKDLKHRVICAGVERLIKDKNLSAADVLLWMDWQVRTCMLVYPTASPWPLCCLF